jgi:hypothetical protein
MTIADCRMQIADRRFRALKRRLGAASEHTATRLERRSHSVSSKTRPVGPSPAFKPGKQTYD